MLDDFIRGGKDIFRRAVILLEPDDFSFGIITLEIKNVADIGAPECVNTLRIIADNAEVSIFRCQMLHENVLRAVCILIFINEDESKSVLILFQYFFMTFK